MVFCCCRALGVLRKPSVGPQLVYKFAPELLAAATQQTVDFLVAAGESHTNLDGQGWDAVAWCCNLPIRSFISNTGGFKTVAICIYCCAHQAVTHRAHVSWITS